MCVVFGNGRHLKMLVRNAASCLKWIPPSSTPPSAPSVWHSVTPSPCCPLVCHCLTFADSHPNSWQQSQAGGRRMKGEGRRSRVSSTDTERAPLLILTKEKKNRVTEKEERFWCLGPLKLPRGKKKKKYPFLACCWSCGLLGGRGRALYLCLRLE